MGDAAQPLQYHGDPPFDELVGEDHHSATGAQGLQLIAKCSN